MSNHAVLTKKNSPAEGYDYSSCNAYFVTICVHDRLPLFGSIHTTDVGAALCGRPNRPDLMIEKWLHELENKYPSVTLDYYIVMPDHIHCILFFDAGSVCTLSEVLGWFKTMTTNAYIRGSKAGLFSPFHGHLWQRSFYEHIIRNEQDLLETRKYIEENPIRWVLKKQHV